MFHSSDEATRNAALVALGATAGSADLPLLINEATSAKNGDDSKLAEKALQTACIRMPDREATAGSSREGDAECIFFGESKLVANSRRDGRAEGVGNGCGGREGRRSRITGYWDTRSRRMDDGGCGARAARNHEELRRRQVSYSRVAWLSPDRTSAEDAGCRAAGDVSPGIGARQSSRGKAVDA